MTTRLKIHDEALWKRLAAECKYNNKALSQMLGISQRQLQRYIRCAFDRSAQDWLNEQRLLLAGEMVQRNSSVKSVALELGFKQVSHFCREFKVYYGESATQYFRRKSFGTDARNSI